MKGKEKCIIWMLNNPMRELEDKTGEYTNVRYNNILGRFESINPNKGYIWDIEPNIELFDKMEMTEVKQPYTFLEAYKECENNKINFVNNYHTKKIEYDRIEKAVYIRTIDGKRFKGIGWAVGKSVWFRTEG